MRARADVWEKEEEVVSHEEKLVPSDEGELGFFFPSTSGRRYSHARASEGSSLFFVTQAVVLKHEVNLYRPSSWNRYIEYRVKQPQTFNTFSIVVK